jgi:hypothetical protein
MRHDNTVHGTIEQLFSPVIFHYNSGIGRNPDHHAGARWRRVAANRV